ncbi:MAG: putative inorganic carbon transporter subunit DabA [Rhodovibrio sp.]|nr:putative inorganic carbon transporter subunit DabA [Rhodovibrio sp.]
MVGGFGVMQGNASDLMTGLPLQSTWQDAETPQHEPLRLLTAVHAPVKRIEAVIQRNDVLKTLFGNGWVALLAIDPESGQTLRRTRAGDWIPAAPKRPAAGRRQDPGGTGGSRDDLTPLPYTWAVARTARPPILTSGRRRS